MEIKDFTAREKVLILRGLITRKRHAEPVEGYESLDMEEYEKLITKFTMFIEDTVEPAELHNARAITNRQPIKIRGDK